MDTYKMALNIRSHMEKRAVSVSGVYKGVRNASKFTGSLASIPIKLLALGVIAANGVRYVSHDAGKAANKWVTTPIREGIKDTIDETSDNLANSVNKSFNKVMGNTVSKADTIGNALAKVTEKTRGSMSSMTRDVGDALHATTFKSLLPLAGASIGGGVGGATGTLLGDAISDDKDSEAVKGRKKMFGGLVGTGLGAVGGFLLANRYKEVMYDVLSGNTKG